MFTQNLIAPLVLLGSHQSFNEIIFQELAVYYEDILRKSGYMNILVFQSTIASK